MTISQDLRNDINFAPLPPKFGGEHILSPPGLGDLGGRCVSPISNKSSEDVNATAQLRGGFLRVLLAQN